MDKEYYVCSKSLFKQECLDVTGKADHSVFGSIKCAGQTTWHQNILRSPSTVTNDNVIQSSLSYSENKHISATMVIYWTHNNRYSTG
jgi:hypothetical protein